MRPLRIGVHVLCTWRFKPRLAPAGLVAAHVADCSPGLRKVLKREWEVEGMSAGVTDHIMVRVWMIFFTRARVRARTSGLVGRKVADRRGEIGRVQFLEQFSRAWAC